MDSDNEVSLRPAKSSNFSAEEQFRLAMESVDDYAIFFTDPENRIVTWNAGAEQIFGWNESEILGQDAKILFTPEDRSSGAAQRELDTAIVEGRAADERWHLRKDGTRFWGSGIVTSLRNEQGGLRGLCKILRDLTERKRWEEALQSAHDKQSRIATALQDSLLMVPPPDAFPGITVKPLYESASDDALIGGDFFDIFAVDESKVAIAVGDATGKGLEASIYTAEVKFALRVLLREYRSTAIALARLNTFLADKERLDPTHLGGSYVALAVCLVDTWTGYLSCSWAGIEPPFVLRNVGAESAVVELSACNGPLLGVDPMSEYREQGLFMSGGDVLAMSTDGLTEARRGRSQNREFFGYEGLIAAVQEEVARNPLSLGDAGVAVARRARGFAGGSINDDVCLVLARCVPQPSKRTPAS